jgi:hypothetical protein
MIEMATPPETVKKTQPIAPRQVLELLASLRLTVVLFALSMFLVFVGTLAQMDASIWTVVKQYFRSWIVVVPLQHFVRFSQVFFGVDPAIQLSSAWSFPFPGGWTIGLLLLVNLLAAHAIRFRMTWKRSGILLLHLGVILLLVGELITGLFQVEQKMTIAVGETVNFTDRSVPPLVELAIVTAVDDRTQEEILIPQSKLKSESTIRDERIPFDVYILSYAPNSMIAGSSKNDPEAVASSNGNYYRVNVKKEESGVDTAEDQPMVRVRFLKKGTEEEIATGTFSTWFYPNLTRVVSVRNFPQFPPQQLTVDGKDYQVSLRPKREYKPHTVKLLEFRHDVYIGTTTPRNFSSLIRLQDAEQKEDRETLIYMNSPLRYRGEAYFQSGYMPGNKGTVLHVVRNPGWLLPYIACCVVTLGMAVHFGISLQGFLKKRAGA